MDLDLWILLWILLSWIWFFVSGLCFWILCLGFDNWILVWIIFSKPDVLLILFFCFGGGGGVGFWISSLGLIFKLRVLDFYVFDPSVLDIEFWVSIVGSHFWVLFFQILFCIGSCFSNGGFWITRSGFNFGIFVSRSSLFKCFIWSLVLDLDLWILFLDFVFVWYCLVFGFMFLDIGFWLSIFWFY